jgi:hypothetical protein
VDVSGRGFCLSHCGSTRPSNRVTSRGRHGWSRWTGTSVSCGRVADLIRAAAVMRRSDRGGTITEPRGRAGDPVRCGTGFQPVSAPVGNRCHTTRGSGRPRVHDTAVSAVR